jgi:hypothetical protein
MCNIKTINKIKFYSGLFILKGVIKNKKTIWLTSNRG